MKNEWKSTPDDHDFMTPGHIAQFLRHNFTGVDNGGRHYLAALIRGHDNPTVLDAACGSAVNWEVFKNTNTQCEYTGLDRAKGFLDHAKELYGDEIKLIEGHVQEMPVEDESYDIVLLRHILEHLEEGYEVAIKEALRVASKEVILVFFLTPTDTPDDDIQESEPDENGCTYFWSQYSWLKLRDFLLGLNVQIQKGGPIYTPGAAHTDFFVRLIK